jgi:hypothetical protein
MWWVRRPYSHNNHVPYTELINEVHKEHGTPPVQETSLSVFKAVTS